MNLADNLKKIRKDNNLSQEQLAEKLSVSRQSVSKWESGISYPEMDKVIQICNLFNLNINELINEDIKEVSEKKEVQKRNNQYITSFFDYITKTVDMFSSMTFKQKVKCLFEQCVVGTILFIILFIIGLIGFELVYSILQLIPEFLYSPIYYLLRNLFLIVAFVFGVVVLLHIFKTRYLDYYEIVKDDSKHSDDLVEEKIIEVEQSKDSKTDDKKNKIFLEKKKETIVIRDPKHTEYGFFKGLGKCLLFIVKVMAALVLGGFVFSLIVFVLCVPISFLIIKNVLLFMGLLLSLVGAISINILILELLYNFIVSRKINKSRLFIVSIISLIAVGIGIGLSCISATALEFVDREYDVVESTYDYDMNDTLILNDWEYLDHEIDYIEKNIDNVQIVIKHSDFYDINVWENDNIINLYCYPNDTKIVKYIRAIIDDISRMTIGKYDEQIDIYIYASKKNIEILRKNKVEYDGQIKILEDRISDLDKELNSYIEENNDLKELIFNSDARVITDNNGKIIEIIYEKEIG